MTHLYCIIRFSLVNKEFFPIDAKINFEGRHFKILIRIHILVHFYFKHANRRVYILCEVGVAVLISTSWSRSIMTSWVVDLWEKATKKLWQHIKLSHFSRCAMVMRRTLSVPWDSALSADGTVGTRHCRQTAQSALGTVGRRRTKIRIFSIIASITSITTVRNATKNHACSLTFLNTHILSH